MSHSSRPAPYSDDSSYEFLLPEKNHNDAIHIDEPLTRTNSIRRATVYLVVTNICTLLAALLFLTLYLTSHNSHASFFPTDIADARPFIQYEQIDFKHKWKFNETTKLPYRDIDANEVQYFGLPNEGIDAAWDELMGSMRLFHAQRGIGDRELMSCR